jgi:hypothetical protein
MDQHDHMPPPDWARVLVNTDQKKQPVGDPTLWGNRVTSLIDDRPQGLAEPAVFYSEQIILAHALDRYSRSWSIIGTVGLSADAWADPNVTPPPNGVLVAGPARLQVFLNVLQGIEKVTIEHQICLVGGGDATNIGLCLNQSTVHAGPYLPRFEAGIEYRSFAAIGALVGNTISARALFIRGGGATPGVIPSATISLIVTPYAPGAGI